MPRGGYNDAPSPRGRAAGVGVALVLVIALAIGGPDGVAIALGALGFFGIVWAVVKSRRSPDRYRPPS